MKVGVMGIGYVGLTTALGFASSGHQVIAYDIDDEKVSSLLSGNLPFYEPGFDELLPEVLQNGNLTINQQLHELVYCDVVFLAIGTPSNPDGTMNVHALNEAFRDLVNLLPKREVPIRIAIKSTVTPQLTRALLENTRYCVNRPVVIFNPEFLREGSALMDFKQTERIVIGTHDGQPDPVMSELWSTVSTAPQITTTFESAEVSKMGANAMLAARLTVLNELARFAHYMQADMGDVLKVLGSDTRIGSSYLRPSFGWGGSCFPKDLKAMGSIYEDMNGKSVTMDARVIPSMVEGNARIIKSWADDILRILRRNKEGLNAPSGLKIAVLGITFKADTDDLRDSPALQLMECLKWSNLRMEFSIYDPSGARCEGRTLIQQCSTFHDSMLPCMADADAILILSPWEEFKTIDPMVLRMIVRTPFIFDGHGIIDGKTFREKGFDVLSVT